VKTPAFDRYSYQITPWKYSPAECPAECAATAMSPLLARMRQWLPVAQNVSPEFNRADGAAIRRRPHEAPWCF